MLSNAELSTLLKLAAGPLPRSCRPSLRLPRFRAGLPCPSSAGLSLTNGRWCHSRPWADDSARAQWYVGLVRGSADLTRVSRSLPTSPMRPNGTSGYRSRSGKNSIPRPNVRFGISDGMSEGLRRLRRVRLARSDADLPRSAPRVGPSLPSSGPLEWDEDVTVG